MSLPRCMADMLCAAGKLFPGPHLYAGAAIVVLWALAASLVPYMQKGNDTARSVHIAANTINLGLFAWQARAGPHALGWVTRCSAPEDHA